MFLHNFLPVAGQRSRQTGNRVKQGLRRFHHTKCDIIANGLHFGQAVGIGICHIRSSCHATHLRILERLNQVNNRIWIQETVRINENNQFPLCHIHAPAERRPFSRIFLLDNIGEAVIDAQTFPYGRFYLLDRLFYYFNGAVRRTVIHHNDLQLIRRIILVHAGENRSPNPCLLVETRNDDRHARFKIRIDFHWTVQCTERIAA